MTSSAGRRAFSAWITGDPAPATMRLLLLLTVRFGEHLPPERLEEIVDGERRGHREALEELRALEEACRDRAPFVAAVVRSGAGGGSR